MSKRILLVDDDALLRRSLAFNLTQAGYSVSNAAVGEDALAIARQTPQDLLLLDIGLPGMDGFEVLRNLQKQTHVPTIFLTARRRELDEVLGLELGADDYVSKPFDLDVLLARIKAVLRRADQAAATPSAQTPITIGDLMIDTLSHTVICAGEQIQLAPREFGLLVALAREAGHVVSTEDLLARVWGAEFAGESQVVYVHIRWLREKLETDPNNPKRIISIRRVGYKLLPSEV